MTSPVYPVFEGDGGVNAPKRPTADVDLGGLSFVDSVKYPPKDRERLSATDYMQATMSLERVARMIPVLIVEGGLETGGPGIDAVVSVNDALTTGNISVTENSSGVYTVSIPSGKLPTSSGRPVVELVNGSGNVSQIDVASYTATSIVLNARDYAGSLTGNTAVFKLKVY